MDVTTRYDLGDVVYGVSTLVARRAPLCPLCDGTGRVSLAVEPPRTSTCPDCHGRRYDQDESHAAEQQRATIYRLTLGSAEWRSETGCSYMAQETGIGSGRRWQEDCLYPTQEEAMTACEDAVVVFGYLHPVDQHLQTVLRGSHDLEAWV